MQTSRLSYNKYNYALQCLFGRVMLYTLQYGMHCIYENACLHHRVLHICK